MLSFEKHKDSQNSITFGNGSERQVKGLSKTDITSDHSILDEFLVDSLYYNLLYVSQSCQIGYNCLFTDFWYYIL
jgi:hypothetical protein